MAQSLPPIPIDVPIVDPEDGTITVLFRLLWQLIQNAFVQVPTVATITLSTQSASIVTAAILTTPAAGLYRVSYYLRKTAADGVSSSLTFTWGWTEGGAPLTQSAAALTTDTNTATQSGTLMVQSDGTASLSYAVAYASNTPGQMKYDVHVVAERLA